MTNNHIEACIEERKNIQGKQKFKIYMLYNGLETVFIQNDEDTVSLAEKFSKKLIDSNEDMQFTDNYGIYQRDDSKNTILSAIMGINDFDKKIINLVRASANLDIESDFTVIFENIEYPLVRDIDVEYKSQDYLFESTKGVSEEVLSDLLLAIWSKNVETSMDEIERRK